MTLKDRQLRDHFDRFIDRDVRYPNYVLTDAAWAAFKKRETHGKKSLTKEASDLIEPLFDAKKGYEITIKTLWEEMAEYWSMGYGWDAPLRATISDVWKRRDGYDKDGNPQMDFRSNRVFLRALFKIRRSIIDNYFLKALLSYTGFDIEQRNRYLTQWKLTNQKYFL